MKRNVVKILKECKKGPREGKYVTTKSGRRVYIHDNGSAYIKQKTNKDDDNSPSISNNN